MEKLTKLERNIRSLYDEEKMPFVTAGEVNLFQHVARTLSDKGMTEKDIHNTLDRALHHRGNYESDKNEAGR